MRVTALILVILVAFILGCVAKSVTRWDMTAAGWKQAEILCIGFGGVVSADEQIFSRGSRIIKAKCASGQVVRRQFVF